MDQEQAIILVEYNTWASHKVILKGLRTRLLWHILQHIVNHGTHHRMRSETTWQCWASHQKT